MEKKDHFPILDISSFQDTRLREPHFLYHELHGERLIDKPHKHDFFLFLLIEKGSGVHAIDFIDYTVSKHQIHLLFPGQVHRWDLKKGTAAYQLMISRPVFEAFSTSLQSSFVYHRNHPVLNLSAECFLDLLHEFKAIQRHLKEVTVSWDLVHARSKTIALLVNKEVEQSYPALKTATNPLLFKYLALIDLHFKEEKSVSFYSAKLNISANYLNILCKRYFQASATSLIQHRVLLEAKRLLQASEHSVKEIAFALGFHDQSYFSNFFKAQTGMVPTAFKHF